jgi:hypothetical protein
LSEARVVLVLVAGGIAAALAWVAQRAARTPSAAADRLVLELRLAQLAALALAFTASAYVGFAVLQEHRPGTALDIALVGGFFVVAAWAPTRDPHEALTVLALAFAAHAVVDVLHRPGGLPVGIAPRWYVVGCAVYDVAMGAVCYLPMLRR